MSIALAAGVSRRDRLAGARPRTGRQTTRRESNSISTRRQSGALPFDGDESGAAEVDESFSDDAGEYDDGGDAEADEGETSYAEESVSTPRSARSSRLHSQSATRSSMSATRPAAAAADAPAAAAAAAPASATRSGRATYSTPAKSARKSAAATAAAAATPAALSPSTPASAGGSARAGAGGGRTRTHRPNEVRMSDTFGAPFSRAQSRAASLAPSAAGDDDDEDDDQQEPQDPSLDQSQLGDDADADADADAIARQYMQPEDVSFDGGDGAFGDDLDADADAAHDDGEERKSAGKRRSSGSAAGSATAAPASSAAAAAAAAPTGSSRGTKRPAAAPRPPGRPGGGRGGRATMAMVQKAHDLGMIGEEEDGFGSADEGDVAPRKRSKRTHLAPVAWWETKEPNLKRTNEGWGAVLPVIDQQNPIIQYASSPAKKVLKPRAAPAKKPSHGGSSSSDRKGDARPKPEPRKAPIPPTMKIFDAADNEVVVQSVAKHMESIPLESLGGAGIDPANLPFPLPHGGKAFEQPEFSSGILMLPPKAKKQLEEANNHELFFVIKAPTNELVVTVHETTFRLSTGSQFMVPVGNRYSMQNLSSSESIMLSFVLVKPATAWMAEWHAQQQAAEAARIEEEEAMRAADEEEEEEEEEEEPPRQQHRGKQKQHGKQRK